MRSVGVHWGRFRTARAQRGHSTTDYAVHPGNTPANHPPYRSGHDPFKTASGGQNPGPWDPWLPAVELSRLFAQRAHSARCAPPLGLTMKDRGNAPRNCHIS